jgi:hypothetical protein
VSALDTVGVERPRSVAAALIPRNSTMRAKIAIASRSGSLDINFPKE